MNKQIIKYSLIKLFSIRLKPGITLALMGLTKLFPFTCLRGFMKFSTFTLVNMQRATASALALLMLCPAGASAAFPDRPVTLVVPFSAGGGTDITARLIAQAMERCGVERVIVVNRAGAGGEIGMASVVTAAADGYTLGIVNTPNALTIPIERPAKFSLDKFELLANIVNDPGTFSVHADSTIRSIADLVAAAKRAPNTLTYGTAGVGSAGHISMLQFENAAGVQLRHIPYKGTSDVRTALLGKQLDIATANLGEALTFARGTPWRLLTADTFSRPAKSTLN